FNGIVPEDAGFDFAVLPIAPFQSPAVAAATSITTFFFAGAPAAPTCQQSCCDSAAVRASQPAIPASFFTSVYCEGRQLHDFAPLLGRLVRADPHAGPVGGLHGIGPRVAVLHEGGDELVDEVRVRAAVAAPLNEREVVGVLDRFREHADR